MTAQTAETVVPLRPAAVGRADYARPGGTRCSFTALDDGRVWVELHEDPGTGPMSFPGSVVDLYEVESDDPALLTWLAARLRVSGGTATQLSLDGRAGVLDTMAARLTAVAKAASMREEAGRLLARADLLDPAAQEPNTGRRVPTTADVVEARLAAAEGLTNWMVRSADGGAVADAIRVLLAATEARPVLVLNDTDAGGTGYVVDLTPAEWDAWNALTDPAYGDGCRPLRFRAEEGTATGIRRGLADALDLLDPCEEGWDCPTCTAVAPLVASRG